MKPKIVLDNEVYLKVMHWVNKSQFEVSGFGMVKVEADGVLRVTGVMLLPQINQSTHTDISNPDHINKALFDLRNYEGYMRWWWHSHVQMPPFWSGTDMDTIKQLGGIDGWFASTVFNQKNEHKSSYYGVLGQTTPWGSTPLFLDDLNTTVERFVHPKATEWDAEYDANVTVKRYAPTSIYAGSHRGFMGMDDTWDKSDQGVFTRGAGKALTSPHCFVKESDFATIEPPELRPVNMKKRDFKAWKKRWNVANQPTLIEDKRTPHEIAYDNWAAEELKSGRETADEPSGNRPDFLRTGEVVNFMTYGLDKEDEAILSAQNWTLEDVEYAMDLDFSPDEIMTIASQDIAPQEFTFLMSDGLSALDLMSMLESREVPVADRRGMIQ